MTITRCYRDGILVDEGFSLDQLDEHLAEEHSIVWVDLLQPTMQQLQTVADELDLHSLAIEDAARDRSRPNFLNNPARL